MVPPLYIACDSDAIIRAAGDWYMRDLISYIRKLWMMEGIMNYINATATEIWNQDDKNRLRSVKDIGKKKDEKYTYFRRESQGMISGWVSERRRYRPLKGYEAKAR